MRSYVKENLAGAGLHYFALANRLDPTIAAALRLYTALLIEPMFCFTAGFRAGKRGLRRFAVPVLNALVMLPLFFVDWWFLIAAYVLICPAAELIGRKKRSERSKGYE